MGQTEATGLLGAALLLAGLAVLLFAPRRSSLTPRTREITEALARIRQATQRRWRILCSRGRLWRARRRHNRRVHRAEALVRRYAEPAPLSALHKLKLYEDRLECGGAVVVLGHRLHASVESAGSVAVKHRSTLTRMGVGGLLMGPLGVVAGAAARKAEEVDHRELYLLVETETGGITVAFNPDDGPALRQLAQQINNAARNVERAKAEREAAHAAAVAQLEAAWDDVAGIEQAEAAVARVQKAR